MDGAEKAQSAVSRRERLKQERETLILEAAAAVFARKGFHQATIRDIAERADVADGTIYNYYSDKRDLLVAITRQVVTSATFKALAAVEAEDDETFLRALLQDRLDFAKKNFDFTRVLLSQVWTDEAFRQAYLKEVIEPLLQVMEGYLQSRVQAGTVRRVNTRVIVQAMAGSFLIFVLLSEPGEEGLFAGVSHKELAAELADFFMRGLQVVPEQGGK